MSMSEKYVQTRIRELLFCRGIESVKVHGSTLNKGYPDLFCGRFWIEVKAPGKKLHASQVEWFELWVDRMGAVAYVCDDYRKLWDVICSPPQATMDLRTQAVWNELGKPGSAPTNWRQFAPRTDHRETMKSALNDWASPAPPRTRR